MAEEKKTESKSRTRRRKIQEEKPVEQLTMDVADEVKSADAPAEIKAEKPVKAVKEDNESASLEALKLQNELLMKQLEAMKEQMNRAPQIIQIANDSEMIDFLWLAPVADDSELLLAGGALGKITGKVGNFSIPKNNLSQMLDSSMRKFIENRWMIVLGGMTDSERAMYGVDYKPGEILDKEVFMRLMDIRDEIVDIYKNLCDASKEVVAKLYYEAWKTPAQKHKVRREIVVAMNRIQTQPGLKNIIEEMNSEDLERQ